MQRFVLYLLLYGLTIASPGPNVLLTLTNALQLRLRGALVSSSQRALQGLQLVGAL